MSVLCLKDVSAQLAGLRVLDGVDLAVAPGEMVALCGPNGAGKTSVLRAALGLLKLESGQVRLSDVALETLSSAERARRVAYLPQDRRIGWNMPAVEIVALGAPRLATQQALARAQAALEAVGAGHLASRGAAEMSGGERARVLFARFLATEAPLLLADEPGAGLDPDAQILVLDLLQAQVRAGAAALVTLHDLALAARYADRLIVLKDGRVAGEGAPRAVLTPAVLEAVFGVSGVWAATPLGPALALGRRP